MAELDQAAGEFELGQALPHQQRVVAGDVAVLQRGHQQRNRLAAPSRAPVEDLEGG